MNIVRFRANASRSFSNVKRVTLDFEKNTYSFEHAESNTPETGELTELYEDHKNPPQFLFTKPTAQESAGTDFGSIPVSAGPGNLTDPTTVPTMGSASANKDLKLDKLPVPGVVRSPENPTPGSITDSGKTGEHDKPSIEKKHVETAREEKNAPNTPAMEPKIAEQLKTGHSAPDKTQPKDKK